MRRPSVTVFAGAVACVLVLHVFPASAASVAANPLCDAKPAGDYGDVNYADPGYQDDGKPRYPIDTERHIRAAWSYIHEARNQSMYTADQVARIEARIVAAWKEKIDPAGPPSAGK